MKAIDQAVASLKGLADGQDDALGQQLGAVVELLQAIKAKAEAIVEVRMGDWYSEDAGAYSDALDEKIDDLFEVLDPYDDGEVQLQPNAEVK
jgi:hypothetical protein